jgi:hypothetical protein
MHPTKLSLLAVFTTILATCLPTHAQQQPVDLIGAGTTILNSIINPPHRTAEINADAEVKKAKIAADAEIEKEKLHIEANKTADKVTPILTKWGVSRVNCTPDVVFINGISADTVCIRPNTAITSGYYSYDGEKQQLIRSSASVQATQATLISTPTSKTTNRQGF